MEGSAVKGNSSYGVFQPLHRGRNADKGLYNGLEHTGGEPREFHVTMGRSSCRARTSWKVVYWSEMFKNTRMRRSL